MTACNLAGQDSGNSGGASFNGVSTHKCDGCVVLLGLQEREGVQ